MAKEKRIQVYNFKTMPSINMRPGLVHSDFRGDNVSIGYNVVTPELVPNPHSHPYEQLFLILEGELKLHIEGEVFDCPAGSIVRIPPNVMHCAMPPKEGRVVNMDIFTPYRAEYGKNCTFQTDDFLQNVPEEAAS